MTDYKFFHPIHVRHSDLDTQWHVNNARYLFYLEEARLAYYRKLNLFEGSNFFELPLIVADIHIAYQASINSGEPILVAVRVKHLGNKSLIFENQILHAETRASRAKAEIVMVAFDYQAQRSVPLPDDLRIKISEFEGIAPGTDKTNKG